MKLCKDCKFLKVSVLAFDLSVCRNTDVTGTNPTDGKSNRLFADHARIYGRCNPEKHFEEKQSILDKFLMLFK